MYYQQPYNPYQCGMSGGITWVQGIEGAKAYQMQPSTSTVLMDSEIEGRMYIKTMDNIGISNLRYFDYREVEANKANEQANKTEQFVTKDDFERVISELKGAMNG